MRDSSNTLLGSLVGFGKNGGIAYVAEFVSSQKFPIPRSMATGAIVQTKIYYTGPSCTGTGYFSEGEADPGAFVINGPGLFRAGVTSMPTLTTVSSYVNASGSGCVGGTTQNIYALGETLLVTGGLYSASVGPLRLEFP